MPRTNLMVCVRTIVMLILLAGTNATASADAPATIRDIVLEHVRRYPKMEVQDLYKLAFQASMGNEHMMADAKHLRAYLDEELAGVDTTGEAPGVEPLVSDSTVVRISLKEFKRHRKDPGALVEAMMKTASRFRKDLNVLKRYWREIETLAAENRIPFALETLRSFFAAMEQKKFPAVHHSKAYAQAYRPAYRVILRDTL